MKNGWSIALYGAANLPNSLVIAGLEKFPDMTFIAEPGGGWVSHILTKIRFRYIPPVTKVQKLR